MATHLIDVPGELVGRIVYRMGDARQVGRVLRVVDKENVEVFWFGNRKPKTVWAGALHDLENLVLETEKKASTYRAMLEKARKEPLP